MQALLFRQKIAYSAGAFAINVFTQTFATYAVFFYVDQLQVSADAIGLAIGVLGILNAVLNPLLGHLSDRTHTRFGRRIPYMALGSIPFAVSFILLFTPHVANDHLPLYFFATALLYDITFVLVALNWTALFPEMFTTLAERSAVSAWRQAFGILGTLFGVALPPILYSTIGWSVMAYVFGFLGLFSVWISLYGAREHAGVQTRTSHLRIWPAITHTFVNRSFVSYVFMSFFVQFPFVLIPSVVPFFMKYVLRVDDVFTTLLLGTLFLVAVPCLYLWSALAKRFGARMAMGMSTSLFGAALVPFAFVHSLLSVWLLMLPLGAGMAGLFVLLDVLISDVIDEDEMKSGVRREGMYYGVQGFIVRFGVTLQAITLSVVLTSTGFSSQRVVQSAPAIAGMRDLLSVVPVASLALALLCLRLYPLHGRRLAVVTRFRMRREQRTAYPLLLPAPHAHGREETAAERC